MRFLALLKVCDVGLSRKQGWNRWLCCALSQLQVSMVDARVAMCMSFSAAGVNGRRVRGYVHVQLCSFLNYVG